MRKLKNKKFDKNQKTLSETWCTKENQISKNKEDSEYNKNQSKVSESKSCMDEEYINNDEDMVASSQNLCQQSKLRQKINKNLLKQSRVQPRKSLKDILPIVREELDEVSIKSCESVSIKVPSNIRTCNARATDSDYLSSINNDKSLNLPIKNTKKKNNRTNKTKLAHNLGLVDKKNIKTEKKLKNVSPDSKYDINLSEEHLQKLRILKVKIQHEVPPQHKNEEIAISKFLNPKEVTIFETYGPLRKTLYTKNEDDVIKKNWKSFCKVHDWDINVVEPFFYLRHNSKYYIPSATQRKNFVRFLADGLPWRSLKSVHNRFRNLYSTSIKRGHYSDKEDEIILLHMKNVEESDVHKCSKLAKILNRKRHSIWQRYQKLKKSNSADSSGDSDSDDFSKKKQNKKRKKYLGSEYNFNRDYNNSGNKEPNKKFKVNGDLDVTFHQKDDQVVWNSETVKKFIDSLIDITSIQGISELKNKIIDEQVWFEMKNRLNIDSTRLKDFWYLQLHMQLFSPEVIHLNDIKIKLITLLYEKEFSADTQWEDLTPDFDGLSSVFLRKLLNNLFQYAQIKIKSSEDKDIMEYLYDYHITELKNDSMDVVLPKLYYKCGRIVCLDQGVGNKIPIKKSNNPLSDEEI